MHRVFHFDVSQLLMRVVTENPIQRAREVLHDPDGRTYLKASARGTLSGTVPFEEVTEEFFDTTMATRSPLAGGLPSIVRTSLNVL